MEGDTTVSIMLNSRKIRKNKATSIEQSTRTRATWGSDQDAQLLQLIQKLGTKWTTIGKIIGNKTGKQVRDRYMYSLRPGISKAKWTEEEDELILSRYEKYGSKWSQIVLAFPGRSENQIKNRFNLKLKKLLTPRKGEDLEDSKERKCMKIVEASPTTEISDSFEANEDYFAEFIKENSLFTYGVEPDFENWVTEEQTNICYDKFNTELSGDISMFFESFLEK